MASADTEPEDETFDLESDEDELDITLASSDHDLPTQNRISNTGRQKSELWSLFTESATPQKLKQAICRHCKSMFNHHKKSELAQKHLLKCIAFRNYVKALEDADVPEWYPRKKRTQVTTYFHLLLSIFNI